jgi:hypothetical protein
MNEKSDPQKTPEPFDFAGEYSRWDRTLIPDSATAMLVWDSFCRFAEHCLLNLNQPVDLGFGRVSAVMARTTWQVQAILKLTRQLALHNKKKKSPGPGKLDQQTLLCEILTDEDMTAWDESRNIFRWCLAIVPTPAFSQTSIALEQAKRKASSDWEQYVLKGYDQLKRQLPATYEAFRFFYKEARHPIACLPESVTKRANVFLSASNNYSSRRRYRTAPKGTAVNWRHRDAPKPGGAPIVVGRSVDMGTAKVVAPENESVHDVRDLQPGCENLRNAGPGVDKPPDGGGGSFGLPVSYADEGVVKDELLALPPDRGENGVA